VNHALGLDYADTQCGYKGYRAARRTNCSAA
jgi:hypothetical protein